MQGNHIEEINNGCLKIDLLQDDGCLEMVSDIETSTVSYKSSIKVEGSKECYASRWHLKYARKAISSSFSHSGGGGEGQKEEKRLAQAWLVCTEILPLVSQSFTVMVLMCRGSQISILLGMKSSPFCIDIQLGFIWNKSPK